MKNEEARAKKPVFTSPFLRRIVTLPDKADPDAFPFDRLGFLAGGRFELDLTEPVTFLVGENGSGKSTLLKAVARVAGFPALGGSRDHRPGLGAERDRLVEAMRLSWLPKVGNGFYFRAESFFGLAGYLGAVGEAGRYGGSKLHHLSHGESFLAVFRHRLHGAERAIYLMDEPADGRAG